MKLFHLVYVPFTGLGLHGGYRGDKWLINRIQIFKQFVLPSLLNQTERDWTLWVSWRPEDRENPIVQDFHRYLGGAMGLSFVFTYGGVCFWDDKYKNEEAGERLIQSLRVNLGELVPYIPSCEKVAVTLQPSDDMYLRDSFEEMLKYSNAEYVVYTKGYIMQYATKRLGDYDPHTTPPFYTLFFPREKFLDPEQHYMFIGPYQSHEHLHKYFKTVKLESRGFVVGTHGENISTTFNHPYQGRTIEGEERDRILLLTDSLEAEPLALPRSPHVRARELLNKLPFQGIIREIYHSLPTWLKIF